jgi:hypothetical protein
MSKTGKMEPGDMNTDRYGRVVFFLAACLALPGYAAGPNECIELSNDKYKNVCREKVSVRWIDEDYCQDGCAAYIPGHSKYKIKSVTGRVRYATCYFPKVAIGDWQNSNKYACK